MTPRIRNALLALLILAGPILAHAQEVTPNASPVITHQPVTKALKGQALTMKAKVTDDKGTLESVTLFYTLSKDAAPFKIPLKPAGLDYYIGTIDAGVLSGASTVSYYIEAQDAWGATRETPWYVITFREPQPGEAAAPAAGSASNAKIPPPGEESKGDSISLGLIAGGAAAVIGGALLIAGSGGDDGGSSDGNPPDDPASKQGTYAGTVTRCLTLNGQSPTCGGHAFTMIIDSKGKVLTGDLHEGQQMSDTLNGSDFTLTADVSDPDAGTTGEIFYNGTVLSNGKIVGSISGSQEGGEGDSAAGVYSGSFSATKQ